VIGRPGEWLAAEAFSQATYDAEMDLVFGRCWLFVGHSSMLRMKHDFFTQYMGETSVVVIRDAADRIRVFLNKCRHRGNMICTYDRGNAGTFTCSYHGWTYGSDGTLTGVPHRAEAYGDGLNVADLGLIEVRSATFGGLIFATFDPDAQTLDDYLGDAKWYLETFLCQEDLGGLEVVPGAQRYRMPANWKLLAENFAGDHYHFLVAHAGVGAALKRERDDRIALSFDAVKKKPVDFSVAANYRRGPAHGFLELRYGEGPYELDLAQAEALGSDAVEWVRERKHRTDARLAAYKAKPYGFHVGNLFPNFSLIGVGSALYGNGLILQHPRAANETEVWMWCAVDKNAPESVKRRQRFVLMQRQAAAGLVAPDDHENFERIADVLGAPGSRNIPLHYGMGIEHDEGDGPSERVDGAEAWPGRMVEPYSELIQRDFYRYWSSLMGGRNGVERN
jgi:phenylpropionate dioxygenase-like ring-hydroxylating dioxygenase large terminal subunit